MTGLAAAVARACSAGSSRAPNATAMTREVSLRCSIEGVPRAAASPPLPLEAPSLARIAAAPGLLLGLSSKPPNSSSGFDCSMGLLAPVVRGGGEERVKLD